MKGRTQIVLNGTCPTIPKDPPPGFRPGKGTCNPSFIPTAGGVLASILNINPVMGQILQIEIGAIAAIGDCEKAQYKLQVAGVALADGFKGIKKVLDGYGPGEPPPGLDPACLGEWNDFQACLKNVRDRLAATYAGLDNLRDRMNAYPCAFNQDADIKSFASELKGYVGQLQAIAGQLAQCQQMLNSILCGNCGNSPPPRKTAAACPPGQYGVWKVISKGNARYVNFVCQGQKPGALDSLG
jgi:hypothetical protein